MPRQRWLVPLAGLLLVLVASGGLVLWHMWIAPGGVSHTVLRVVHFSDLPGWNETDARAALAAFRRSCAVLETKPVNARMGEGGYAGLASDWAESCARAPASGTTLAVARAFFEAAFAPLEIRQTDGAAALFTGYYEPELAASRTRNGHYTTPVYGLPASWARANLGQFRRNLEGQQIEGCVRQHSFSPCSARGEIDKHGLPDAPILFYADDPVSVFFLHIQGSGRARFDDGSMIRVAYAGQNGRPYTPIGRVLIERGLLDRQHMSMQAIRAWLRANSTRAQAIMESDNSYVFFRERPIGDPLLGSPGTQGVPLTPQASLAIDPRVHPLGAPFYVVARRPDEDPRREDRQLRHLFIAQDTGGAIRGPLRADLFWGFGPEAESIAGRLKATGRLFVLVPKKAAARLGKALELPVS